jgi:hypothetical protein
MRYATSQKVADSSSIEVIALFFNLSNPSSRAMTLGFTQLLTEMSTRRIFLGSRAWPARKVDNFHL